MKLAQRVVFAEAAWLQSAHLPPCGGESDFEGLAERFFARRLNLRNRKRGGHILDLALAAIRSHTPAGFCRISLFQILIVRKPLAAKWASRSSSETESKC